MVKSRFSTLDLAATIAELQGLQGMRVANIYDVDQKTYLLKLAKGEQKAMLLVESGIRIHKTDYAWPKSMMPSGFSMKMRKHIRTRRVECVRQLGVDRVLDLEFGQGELCTHLIIELYAKGNIILTDGEYRILSLLRSRTHTVKPGETEDGGGGDKKDDNNDVRIAVGEIYPFQLTRAEFDLRTEQDLRQSLSSAAPNDNVKKALINFYSDVGPALLEHCIRLADVDPLAKCATLDVSQESELIPRLFACLESAKAITAAAANATTPSKGYIIQRVEKKAVTTGTADDNLLVYDEFHPLLMKQHENKPHIEFATFNEAVDEFFSKLESQKIDMRAVQQQKAAMKKLENFQKGHDERLRALAEEQGHGELCAFLIESNVQLVDSAIQAVNSLLATGMDWDHVKAMVDEAKSMRDPVAVHIHSLRLEKNAIVLNLRDPYVYDDEFDSDDEEGQPKQSKPVQVEIDLAMGGHANARKYHHRKKQAKSKEQKTKDVSKQALKTVEKATKQKVKEVEVKAQITKARKAYWFEKFLWFISSDNYLVIAGRDAQQNELIVKRHFRKGDLYVHADIHGAATCIIKNHNSETLPPPRTLSEAGVMAICYSSAWDAKIVISAYWVHHHQVSKSAPTGEYLTTGSFMVRGKKNFLPPAPLVMGFGALFRIDESCIPNHVHERRPLYGEGGDEEVVATAREYEERSHKVQLRQRPSKPASDGAEHEDSLEPDADEDEDEDVASPATGTPANETNGAVVTEGQPAEPSESSDDEDEGGLHFPDTSVGMSYVTSYLGSTPQPDSDTGSDIGHEEAALAHEEKKKAYITAKQRRDMKKGKQPGPSGDQAAKAEDEDARKSPAPQKTKAQQPAPAPVPRGKKGKMKKMKEKYADQDEEERQLRMEILKSAGDPASNAKKNKKDAEAKKAPAGKGKQQGPAPTVKPSAVPPAAPRPQPATQEPGVADGVPEQAPSTEQKPGPEREAVMQARQTRKAEKAHEAEELRQLMAEENIMDDEDKESLTLLDSLTGCPRGDDLLVFAMAYCAPYTSMQNFKYKVKVQPGSQKKGKAAKQATELFVRNADVPLEKDLIRAIPDPELTQMMPSKVKLSAPNLHSHTKKK